MKKFCWSLYSAVLFVNFAFVIPRLISSKSDFDVIVGIVVLIGIIIVTIDGVIRLLRSKTHE